MNRRQITLLAGAAGIGSLSCSARAHHGWSSFDAERPLYLEGRAAEVKWRNPHAELVLEVAPNLRLPPDLKARRLPAQQAPVDSQALLAKTALPARKDRRWTIELAPLTRMSQWQVPELREGATLAVIGFSFPSEAGEPILRAEYLFTGGKSYAMRSSPA